MTAAALSGEGLESRVEWEQALIHRATQGDSLAFERLYREHAGRVYGLCLRLTRDPDKAEDCVQETFINAWRALKGFETRSSLGTWLHRIAVNVVLARRRRYTPPTESLSDVPEVVESDWTLDTPVEVSEIEAAIAALPDGARDVLVLSGIYGYPHEETAQMLGIAVGTCKAQLHRARKLLQERLGVEIR
ncbi:MAG TPA: sigma-70 family RNA polymerase sigma factor [Steroidobacteraceae bacterium]